MRLNYIILSGLLFLISCSSHIKKEKEKVEIKDKTPELLKKGESSFTYGRSKKRDIIFKLYGEALKDNPKLSELDASIEELRKLKNDSLKTFYKYLDVNEDYWRVAHQYINRLGDTILREKTRQVFQKFEINYANKISAQRKKITALEELSETLKDQYIIMKLLVTSRMIKNYQVNERPNTTYIDSLAFQYKNIIKNLKNISSKK